jgi:hypothetical protein
MDAKMPLLVLAGAIIVTAPALAWETRGGESGEYSAKVAASQPIKGPGDKAARPVLSVSCTTGGLYATISWPDPIPLNEGQHFVSVNWSLGGASRTSPMLATPGSVGLAGSEAKEWLREFGSASRLEVSVPDAHGGQSASFDLAGAKTVQDGIEGSSCGG